MFPESSEDSFPPNRHSAPTIGASPRAPDVYLPKCFGIKLPGMGADESIGWLVLLW